MSCYQRSQAHSTRGDVSLDNHTNPRTVQFHLQRSKCDQLGKGSDIIMGATDNSLCPVQAITCYVTMRGSTPGPLFQKAAGATVTKPWFVKEIRARLAECGLHQSDFAGHSFRIGAAQQQRPWQGVENSTIQILGRWHSTAFLLYVRIPKWRLASPPSPNNFSSPHRHSTLPLTPPLTNTCPSQTVTVFLLLSGHRHYI